MKFRRHASTRIVTPGDNDDPLVSLERVDVAIGGKTVLRDLTWRLEAGRHWGVTGANGSGKSTFLALVAGARWPAPGRGARRYDFGRGPERDAVTARRLITLVGHELQDKYSKLDWNFTAADVVLSGLQGADVPQRGATRAERAEAERLLDALGLAELATRRFLELSRGEQRRVLIARALGFAPRVLLLDEPASGLDSVARVDLERLVARAAESTQVLVAAHTADQLPGIVTHVLELDDGRIRAQRVAGAGAVEKAAPPERGTGLDGDVQGATTRMDAPPPAQTAPRLGAATDLDSTARIDAPPRPDATRRVSAAAPAADDGGPDDVAPLIDVRRATVWLEGRPALWRVDWQLATGEHWLVTGANGAGKSTLLKLAHGALRPGRGGTIRWPGLGEPRDVWSLRRLVGWVSPELQARYVYRATVAECIGSGITSSIGPVRALSGPERGRVAELLQAFELEPLASRGLASLSYGQARRVLIARALASRPRVLLLDEPCEGLDPATAALVAARLREASDAGTTLVCASHLGDLGLELHHELALERGRVVYQGPVRAPRRDDAGGARRGSSASAHSPERGSRERSP